MRDINILHIVIWKEEKFFVANCLEFGVASQGESYKEAKKNIQEAIELYLEETDELQEKQYIPHINDIRFDEIKINSLNINV